jgi:hypothetical protein
MDILINVFLASAMVRSELSASHIGGFTTGGKPQVPVGKEVG